MILATLTLAVMASAQSAVFTFPECADGPRMTKTEYCKVTENMSWTSRDSVTLSEIKKGNIPTYLRHAVTINERLEDARGQVHDVGLRVLPDFLAIGPDEDYMLVPVMPTTASEIAELSGASLVTTKISDIIHRHANVLLTPHPMTPDSTMNSTPVFARHDSIVRSAYRPVAPMLIDGHKKDIVLTKLIPDNPGKLFIYGWHRPDGSYIQPLHGKHADWYLDYSHGLRLVAREVIVDGEPLDIRYILTHPVLYALLSDEDGPMEMTCYPTE